MSTCSPKDPKLQARTYWGLSSPLERKVAERAELRRMAEAHAAVREACPKEQVEDARTFHVHR